MRPIGAYWWLRGWPIGGLFVSSMVGMWLLLLPSLLVASSGKSLSKSADGFQPFWVLFCVFGGPNVVQIAAFAFGVF